MSRLRSWALSAFLPIPQLFCSVSTSRARKTLRKVLRITATTPKTGISSDSEG